MQAGLKLVLTSTILPPTSPFIAQTPACFFLAAGQYLAACDGTRGSLRQQLGISMGGPGAIQHLINIHFLSPQVRNGTRLLYLVHVV